MKKIGAIIMLLCTMLFAMAGCSDAKNGTQYPDCAEMKKNLENRQYAVTITQNSEYTCLLAVKDKDSLEFYWLTNADSIHTIASLLEDSRSDYDTLVSLENDSSFGSLVFCGTKRAVDDAGIQIVDVKVHVK